MLAFHAFATCDSIRTSTIRLFRPFSLQTPEVFDGNKLEDREEESQTVPTQLNAVELQMSYARRDCVVVTAAVDADGYG